MTAMMMTADRVWPCQCAQNLKGCDGSAIEISKTAIQKTEPPKKETSGWRDIVLHMR
jgi:hypothetical protein